MVMTAVEDERVRRSWYLALSGRSKLDNQLAFAVFVEGTEDGNAGIGILLEIDLGLDESTKRRSVRSEISSTRSDIRVDRSQLA